jgi:excisionase family DNA binding protein
MEVNSMVKLLRVEEAAEALGLKTPTLRRMIRRGQLQAVRPTGARAVRVRSEDVEALIRAGSAIPKRQQGSVRIEQMDSPSAERAQ